MLGLRPEDGDAAALASPRSPSAHHCTRLLSLQCCHQPSPILLCFSVAGRNLLRVSVGFWKKLFPAHPPSLKALGKLKAMCCYYQTRV